MLRVDSREPEEISAPFVRAGWNREALDCGDFEFPDVSGEVVVIERKSIKQLLTDLGSGQLQKQCRKLVEASSFPILLCEGRWIQNNGYLLDTRWTWQATWDALQTLQDLGVRLQLTTSLEHTIERVFQLQRYYSKEFHASIARHPSGDPYITVVSHIYGISEVKAKWIKQPFPHLNLLASATLEDIESVPNIGPKLARRIYDFWRS